MAHDFRDNPSYDSEKASDASADTRAEIFAQHKSQRKYYDLQHVEQKLNTL